MAKRLSSAVETDDSDNGKATSADHLRALETKEPAKPVRPMQLAKLDLRIMDVPIVGTSSLIVHQWSKKAKEQMLGKQMGVATEGKEPKDPEQDYQDSLYKLPDGGFGFPAIGFKCAAVTACTSLGKSITKVAARQAFHVLGEMVRIEGTPSMREDMVRIGQGTADIRFRGEFKEWSCVLRIEYNARVLTDEQIVNLFNIAGFAVGVGEWRVERDGQNGRFRVGKK